MTTVKKTIEETQVNLILGKYLFLSSNKKKPQPFQHVEVVSASYVLTATLLLGQITHEMKGYRCYAVTMEGLFSVLCSNMK